LAGCSRGAPNSPDAGLKSFSADALMKHIRTLSSDQFEGRGPGSKGEELTVKYLEEQFRGIGLRPGNPDGSYVQKVPLVGILLDPRMKLTITRAGREALLAIPATLRSFHQARGRRGQHRC